MADRTFFVVESGKLITYARHGECKSCGECCRCLIQYNVPTFALKRKTDDSLGGSDSSDWKDFEGYSVTLAHGLWWYWPPLTIKREEVGECKSLCDGKICKVWWLDDWPSLCEHFPMRPEDIVPFPECGFSFERIEQ